ncbi:DUF6443 domain-containing protein [Chryseobacterium gallinarum]|uniref:RHS repeat-associated core domain-containing protein n=1 Tax=Chryseobacterium gallinarum TaxID=1324352 RepID=A0ABX6KQ19_CHRGL|nr:DUF6443 domain-containing protein [Chryseobacterium gallinarum]QIY90537.1 RHS repeat-associated core domain-containing protein [Chryseobacterium gallinarum]
MKKFLNVLSILFVTSAFAQTNLTATENYTYSKTCLNDDCTRISENVQYFDSWGRPVQAVAIKASPQGNDIVTHIEYDPYGRQVKDYLPVPQPGTQNGALYTSPLANASSVYGNEKIYSEKLVENSPLERIRQQFSPGNDWNNKPVVFSYNTNTEGEVVKYSVTTTWIEGRTNSVLTANGNYAANTLTKNTVTDEDGNVSIEFKNKQGQSILVRKMISATEKADTYYVYNEFGQLAYTLPPLASVSGSVSASTLDDLCYQYRYDGWNRLVEKKLPGKGWEYMVYDKADRLILSQDATLRTQNKWLVNKYDPLGRVAYTGLLEGGDRAGRQHIIRDGVITESRSSTGFTRNGMTVYYTNGNYGDEISTILSIHYYDTYPAGTPAAPAQIMGQNILSQDAQNNVVSTKSLPAATYVKNIEDDNWTQTYIWYDTKGRAVGTHTVNHLGGYTRTGSEIDFAGLVKQTKTYHKRLASDTEKIITQTFEYDLQGRKKKHYHQVDNQPQELLAENTYNELSQLTNKKVGNNLQSIDYAYNIRGWMTRINDPANLNGKLFGYEIKYHNPVYTNLASGRFNGNIAEVDWRNSSEDVLKRYSYTYDGLNRLKDAVYSEPGATNPFNNNYNESLTYDVNGNIKTLKRNAFPVTGTTATLVDDLTYQYIGNRLDKVIENALNATGYEGGNNPIDYDDNGNMTSMKDKWIQKMEYNALNLPNTINIQQVTPTQKIMTTNIRTLYRADGVKLRKTNVLFPYMGNPVTRITDYLDGFQYRYYDDGSGVCMTCATELAYEPQAYKKIIGPVFPPAPEWKLDFVATAEGFYSFIENRYIYQYKDHLGNVRVSFAQNSAGVPEIINTNNYYPFGLNYIGGGNSSGIGSFYSYKYNGKELQETGFYDYGARMYMPDLGRWGVVDPLAETSRSWSPYAYAYNNPVMFIDPDGRQNVSALHWKFDQNTTIYGKSWFEDSYMNAGFNRNFKTMWNGGDHGGSGRLTFTGNQAASMFNYFKNGGGMSGLNFTNNYVSWWTGAATQTSYRMGEDIYGEADLGELHRVRLMDEDILDNANFINDRIGDFATFLEKNTRSQGGSIAFWTTPARSRSFDGINYSRFNLRYYRNNWRGNGYTGATRSVATYLGKSALVTQIVLGAIEVGNGITDDYNDYDKKGITYGKNTAVAGTKVATGAIVGYAAGAGATWLTGAIAGAVGGSVAPGVGTVIGFVVGGFAAFYASEYAGNLVENAYK